MKAIASAPLSSIASATVADLSVSSTAAIQSSYRDPGRHVLDVVTDDSSARINDQGYPSDAVVRRPLHGLSDPAAVDVQAVLEAVQQGKDVAFSSLSSPTAAHVRISVVLSGAKYIDLRMVATGGIRPRSGDLMDAKSRKVQEIGSVYQTETTKTTPSWTYVVGSCMVVLLAMCLFAPQGVALAMVALGVKLFRSSGMGKSSASTSTSASEGGSREIASSMNRLGGKISQRASLSGLVMPLLASARW